MSAEGSSGAPAPDTASAPLEILIHHHSPEVLRGVAAHAQLTEELALALLARRDLPPEVIEALTKNRTVMKSRRVLLAALCHLRTPRHISLPGTRHLYTFELMHIALEPTIAADIKLAAEEALVARLETISSGERLSLARRASTRVAAALLCDPEQRVVDAALDNARLTEVWVVRALQKGRAPEGLVEAVCRHPKWSLRRDVQIALLRNQHTPAARAIYFAKSLPTEVLRDIVSHARISATVKIELLREIHEREASTGSAGV